MDAEDVAHDLDGVHHEIDGSSFVSGECGRTAIVVHVECYLCGTMRGYVVIEVESVSGGNGNVLSVVEEIDGFAAAGSPAVA